MLGLLLPVRRKVIILVNCELISTQHFPFCPKVSRAILSQMRFVFRVLNENKKVYYALVGDFRYLERFSRYFRSFQAVISARANTKLPARILLSH